VLNLFQLKVPALLNIGSLKSTNDEKSALADEIINFGMDNDHIFNHLIFTLLPLHFLNISTRWDFSAFITNKLPIFLAYGT